MSDTTVNKKLIEQYDGLVSSLIDTRTNLLEALEVYREANQDLRRDNKEYKETIADLRKQLAVTNPWRGV
tara:strand:+ start:669 stop:878 length:210 start_codon:yes stop_codon:yes gene_type:complete